MKKIISLLLAVVFGLLFNCEQAPKKKKVEKETTVVETTESIEIILNSKSGSNTSGTVHF